MRVKDLLKNKGPEVFTIGAEKTLFEAITILVNNNVGSLIVLNNEAKIRGIITERDVLRQSFKHPNGFKEILVQDVMSTNIIVVEPDDEMSYCEKTMTENRIRHLPVVNKKVLVGIISIGDIVKAQSKEIRHENKYLRDYIEGTAMG